MRTHDQVWEAERTAASATDLPAVERRAEEFSARRRGAVRTWLHRHSRIMDVVVAVVYLLAGSGIFIGSRPDVDWSAHFVIVGASAVVLMFRRDKPLAVLAILSVFELLDIATVPNTGRTGPQPPKQTSFRPS